MSNLNKNIASYYFDSIVINGSKTLSAWLGKFESEVLRYKKLSTRKI